MAQDLFDYPKMVDTALRSVVREALARVQREGLRGAHHFYLSFQSDAAGVAIPKYLLTKYPEEMTIVLQHQFWALEVRDQDFSVTLSFQNRPEELTVPFSAMTGFVDPSVSFALRFDVAEAKPPDTPALPAKTPTEERVEPQRPAAEIVTLDKFRKR